jgi:hypothetical protein
MVDRLSPSQLSDLLAMGDHSLWNQNDGAAALRHQLASPLLPDVDISDCANVGRTAALTNLTFEEHLLASNPSVDALKGIKQFARLVRDDLTNPLHGAPATVLYYAAIAAALIQGAERITTLANQDLHNGFRWAIDQPGAESLFDLFQRALRLLSGRSRCSRPDPRFN